MYRRDEPSALFHFLHHAHRRRVSEEQSGRGLRDLGAPMVLFTLFHEGQRQDARLSQRELARKLRVSPATVAVSLKTLERDGYVERSVDEKDQRRNLVSLTPKGRKAVELCGESFCAVDEQMLEGFSPQEKAQLNDFFLRMLANLGVKAEDVPPPPPRPGRRREHPFGKEDERL